MTLIVTYDNEQKGICVSTTNEVGKISMLKMELDEQAELLYKVLTKQSVKIKEIFEPTEG